MRGSLVMAVLFAASCATPALALQPGDPMSAWKNSSDADRAALLKQLLGDAVRPGLRKCLDETARAPGHAELPISEVAKVCASAVEHEQPV